MIVDVLIQPHTHIHINIFNNRHSQHVIVYNGLFLMIPLGSALTYFGDHKHNRRISTVSTQYSVEQNGNPAIMHVIPEMPK